MYEVTGDIQELNIGATGVDEILQNISMILRTPKYSVPFDRNFGIDASMVDLPIEVAENLLTVRIIEAIQEYEPRATVQKVSYTKNNSTGTLKPKVQVIINGIK
ncbi:GPW/gp25 family protein [Cellulosilyticum sp. ST5]|uniref:GPW/gp25 family protein n=1 Tax=unclassified Cellulosilyticum TaxID=2643091 RepID=UPI000F8D569E|nr:GPW/gp25 family protein [Cellulosilyticum sp. WCF-2]QEH67256.1 GPW/gp25 family protein [Cellulosilyticum sp. WCF-2]